MGKLSEVIAQYGIKPNAGLVFENIPAGVVGTADVVEATTGQSSQQQTPYVDLKFTFNNGPYKGRSIKQRLYASPPKPKFDKDGNAVMDEQTGEQKWTQGTLGQVVYTFEALAGEEMPDYNVTNADGSPNTEGLMQAAEAIATAAQGKVAIIVVEHERDRQDKTKVWPRAKVIQVSDPNYAKKLSAVGIETPKPPAPKQPVKAPIAKAPAKRKVSAKAELPF